MVSWHHPGDVYHEGIYFDQNCLYNQNLQSLFSRFLPNGSCLRSTSFSLRRFLLVLKKYPVPAALTICTRMVLVDRSIRDRGMRMIVSLPASDTLLLWWNWTVSFQSTYFDFALATGKWERAMTWIRAFQMKLENQIKRNMQENWFRILKVDG